MILSCVEQGYRNRRLIYDYLKQIDRPLDAKTISQKMGISTGSVHIHCRNLIRLGLVSESLVKIEVIKNQLPRPIIHYCIK
jgi:predicted DNA-binding transcriptional regulator